MHRLGFVLSEGFQLMALATQAVFEFANDVVEDRFYDFACYSVAGGDVISSSGVRIGTQPLASCTQADTWLVAGCSDPIVAPTQPEVLKFLRRAGRHARRMAGLCTGGFALAEAGLLDGRRATTHWLFARDMQARHPDVRVDDDRIFIVDGPV